VDPRLAGERPELGFRVAQSLVDASLEADVGVGEKEIAVLLGERTDAREGFPPDRPVLVAARRDARDAGGGLTIPPGAPAHAVDVGVERLMGKCRLVALQTVVAHVPTAHVDVRRGEDDHHRKHECRAQKERHRRVAHCGREAIGEQAPEAKDRDRTDDRDEHHDESEIAKEQLRDRPDEKDQRVGHENEQPGTEIAEESGGFGLGGLGSAEQARRHDDGGERGEDRGHEQEFREQLGRARADLPERVTPLTHDRRRIRTPREQVAREFARHALDRPDERLPTRRPPGEEKREPDHLSIERTVSADLPATPKQSTARLHCRDRCEEDERVRRLLRVIEHEGDGPDREQDPGSRERRFGQGELTEDVLDAQIQHERREQHRLGDRMGLHVVGRDVVDREQTEGDERADVGRFGATGDHPGTERDEHQKGDRDREDDEQHRPHHPDPQQLGEKDRERMQSRVK